MSATGNISKQDDSLYLENTKNVKRIHLTLTGAYAGMPLCPCDKQAEKLKGASFFHAIFAPEFVFQDERLCHICAEEWKIAND